MKKNTFWGIIIFIFSLSLFNYPALCQKATALSKTDSILAINELKNLNNHYKTWIRNLPGITAKTGEEVNAYNLKLNKSGGGEITVNFKKREAVINPIMNLLKTKQRTQEILLTVRSSVNGGDKCYVLNDVSVLKTQDRNPIESTKPMKYDSIEVSLNFKSLTVVACGMQMNPGPPANAPAINPKGFNKGWVHFHYTKNPEEGTPFDILSYTVNADNIEITINKDNAYLFEHILNLEELILILPNTRTLKYEEYRIFGVKTVSVVGTEQVIKIELRINEILH